MDKVLNLYKNIGETPLERINRLREEKPEYRGETLTYAGRLDPMAEGVLLVLAGQENKKREEYLGLSKEYLFEVIWGLKTDSFDILGIVQANREDLSQVKEKLLKEIKSYHGKIVQKYPPYSSKPVLGKPLFQWAREGRLDEIDLPEREVEIYSLELLESFFFGKGTLKEKIAERVSLVKGDFRQEEILEEWSKVFEKDPKEEFLISKMRVSASSGFYVRALVEDLGCKLGCGATTFSIIRTKVGEYKIEDSV